MFLLELLGPRPHYIGVTILVKSPFINKLQIVSHYETKRIFIFISHFLTTRSKTDNVTPQTGPSGHCGVVRYRWA